MGSEEEMKRNVISSMSAIAIVAAVVGFVSLSSSVFAQKQPAPPASVISPVKAMKLGAAKAKGRALNCTLEFDEGHWVYGVIVVSGKTLQEVELDPATGNIGDVEKITPDGEGKEMTAQLKKAIGGGPAKASKENDEEKSGKEITGGGF